MRRAEQTLTTNGRNTENAIPGTEEVILTANSHQIFQSLKASTTSLLVNVASPPTALTRSSASWLGPASTSRNSSSPSTPALERRRVCLSGSTTTTGPAPSYPYRSRRTRFSAHSRSSPLLSHQAVPGPLDSQENAVRATMMVKNPSNRKSSW